MKNIIILLSLLSLSFTAMASQSDSLALTDTVARVESTTVVETNDLWDRANTAYINEDYKGAIDIYTKIVESGLTSEKLHFNMGNAYYKSGDIARAILHYQKAHKIDPTDKDVIYNLEVAQTQTKDKIEVLPEFFIKSWSHAIQRMLGCTGWTLVSLLSLIVLLSCVGVFLLSHSLRSRKIGFGVGCVAIIFALISLLYALAARKEMITTDSGVVMSRSIAIKSSPDNSSTDLFMLHEGTTVNIQREVDGWYEITIADGKQGWIEKRRIEVI